MIDVIDYREMLRLELVVRRIRNPKYSLRAFARDCMISPSRFSEVLRNKNNLSPKSGTKIARQLGMSVQEAQFFIYSITKESIKEDSRKSGMKKTSIFHPTQITSDINLSILYQPVLQWRNNILLEILNHRNFLIIEKWISETIGTRIYSYKSALCKTRT